jgi:hypothetical protein
MFRYKIDLEDGSDAGEGPTAEWINAGEVIHIAGAERFRVIDVVPFEEDASPFVGLLRVEPHACTEQTAARAAVFRCVSGVPATRGCQAVQPSVSEPSLGHPLRVTTYTRWSASRSRTS